MFYAIFIMFYFHSLLNALSFLSSSSQVYNLYSEGNLEFSGLSRSFLFRRLEPWTIYSLSLEACTSAGCTRSPPQHIATAAAPPASQLPPRLLFLGPDHVSLTWSPPSQPNGPIEEYSLRGRSLEEKGRLRSNEEEAEEGKVSETKATELFLNVLILFVLRFKN